MSEVYFRFIQVKIAKGTKLADSAAGPEVMLCWDNIKKRGAFR